MNFLSEESIQNLAEKKLAGIITPEEDEILNGFLNKDITEDLVWISEDADENALRERILKQINKSAGINKKAPVHLFKRMIAAAAFFTAVALAGWFIVSKKRAIDTHGEISVYTEKFDLPPGSNGATLTLSNGKRIALDSIANGKIAQQGFSQVINRNGFIEYDLNSASHTKDKTGADVLNTIATARGRQFAVKLCDGTKVWLNAGTVFTFPAAFQRNERRVFVSGEAYFEVAKDKASPFRVIIDNKDSVEVLGTRFNICSYRDDSKSSTTLLEGSVKIDNQFILKPGQQFRSMPDKKPQIITADTTEAVAWKNGMFIYNDAEIAAILKQIGRWYDLDIIIRGEPVADRFSGAIPRNVSLETALKVLKYSGVDFKVEGKTLIVSSKR